MTSAEQQLAIEQARAKIERNLGEISALAADPGIEPNKFFPRFLDLALSSLDALGGAVWLFEGDALQRVAEVSFASSGYGSPRQRGWIDAVLAQTVNSKKPCIVAVNDVVFAGGDPPEGGIGNEVPHPFFYIPVVVDDRVRLVLQVWLKQAGDPRSYSDISAFLLQLAMHPANHLRGLERRQLAERNERAQHMVRLQTELLGELDPAVLMLATANFLVDLLPCDLACVFRRKGKAWILAAASNQEMVDPRSIHSRALSQLAGLLPVNFDGEILAASPGGGEVAEALAGAGLHQVVWCHTRSSKHAGADVLLLGGRHSPAVVVTQDRDTVAWCAGQLAKALDAATHFQHIPLRPLASLAGKTLRAWGQNRRRKVFGLLIAPALLLGGAMLIPLPWKISTDFTVAPAHTASVVAQTSGKVAEVLAREGQEVGPGELLGRMDDTDLTTQLAIARQQLLRWQVEVGKAQTLNSDVDRRIAELNVARESETIRRLEFLRSKTELVSPIHGVVLTRNLHNREGEAFEPGKIFCEVASRNDFDLLLDIRQKDLGAVLAALSDETPLPVDFILHSHAHVRMQAALTARDQIAQLPEPRRQETVFIARIPFPADSLPDGLLKPGYTGKAKILVGRKPVWFLLSRPFLQYWKTTWGV